MDIAEGGNRGHVVELHWQSACALLHDVGTPTSGPEQVASENVCTRYMVSTGFLRPGYSRHRLLALHPTLLPSTPMISEFLLLVFSREVSWLVAEPPGEIDPASVTLAGAEVCTGDDATMLVFTQTVSDEDVQLVNAVRAVRLQSVSLGATFLNYRLRRI